jgi:iron complex transport system substrate-binding protein
VTTTRIPRRAVFAALTAVILAACGSGGTASPTPVNPAPGASASAGPSTAPSSQADFPVTIRHEFGETTVEEEPTRVVSIGFTDHDVLLALGVEPIAIRHWYGDYEFVWPWAEEALGTSRPTVLPSTDLDFEQIAALRPDLIIGQYVGLEREEYELLSEIAPTIAQPADYPAFGAPWQEMTRTIGAAVGRSAEAETLIADVEGQFADVRAAHPEFEGVELAYAGVYGTDAANYYVETDGSTRMRVLQNLGFVVPPELAALGSDAFYHDISPEQLSLLDQDVVLWEPAVLELLPEVKSNPLYQSLDVAKEERDVFLTDPVVAGAMAHSTVLSLPVVLEFLEPELTRAVGNLAP